MAGERVAEPLAKRINTIQNSAPVEREHWQLIPEHSSLQRLTDKPAEQAGPPLFLPIRVTNGGKVVV